MTSRPKKPTLMQKYLHYENRDIIAGLVVFLVALPLCLGIAIASHAPPEMGLVSGIISGLIIGPIAGCPLQVSGPAAGLAVLVWEIIDNFGLSGLALACIVCGLVQSTAGFLKLGKWFRAVSPAVISGMLAGIGLIILASQLHVMIDAKPVKSPLDNFAAVPSALAKVFGGSNSHFYAACLGLITIGIIFFWNRMRPKSLNMIPAPLVAILPVVLIQLFGQFPVATVSVPASLWQGAVFGSNSLLRQVDTNILTNGTFWVATFGLAIVASTATLLCATATDKLQNFYRTDYDQELKAQGLGNILCGLLGGLPVAGVIVRSSANVDAGARTRWSAVLHGIWLLGFVSLAPGALKYIPVSALAAILVYTGIKLANPMQVRDFFRVSTGDGLVFLATVIGILRTDLLKGVGIGLGAAMLHIVWQIARLDIDIEEIGDNIILVKLSGAATFIRLPHLSHELDKIPRQIEAHLDLSDVTLLDHACIELLQEFQRTHQKHGGEVVQVGGEIELGFKKSDANIPMPKTTPSPIVATSQN